MNNDIESTATFSYTLLYFTYVRPLRAVTDITHVREVGRFSPCGSSHHDTRGRPPSEPPGYSAQTPPSFSADDRTYTEIATRIARGHIIS